MIAAFETQPTRVFTVSAAPRCAITTALAHLSAQGFSVDGWSLDQTLQQHGGWTGASATQGSELSGTLIGALTELLPALIAVPGLQRHRGRITIALAARTRADDLCDLAASHVSGATASMTSAKDYAANVLEDLASAFANEGTLVDGPHTVSANRLPADHPFNIAHWVQIKKTTKRRDRQTR